MVAIYLYVKSCPLKSLGCLTFYDIVAFPLLRVNKIIGGHKLCCDNQMDGVDLLLHVTI